ncbi:2,4'-dihydroxyacetophenone dioxygenase family protein [Candidatus Marimicrobium litorale]|uniref:Cupin n=1 Tax=Candidatus Marimicrobium litorale TaxID=2518991 RepID=A0ABT3T5N9_9GAMM|nr:2,4'-dihydroxyacetophenone dioxygenase family protein [Candidatus Marimicrobium litorale]MCX2976802.1 cupin [Candidatus Marimicrobium litorale]
MNQPEAVHIGSDDLPWVDIGDGSQLRVLQVKPKEGLWIVENIFQAGYEVETHKHTGPVWGYTRSGAWKYKEYDYVNTTGSFLYEPAGSVHTLQCIEDNTQVWFQMHGSNINLDGDGNITSVADGMITLEFYFAMCAEMGKPNPPVLVD